MFPVSRLWSCFAFSLLGFWGLKGQSSRLDFIQYGTASGLPSSETYFAYEDTRGFLWIGSDNGLARFDGYEFEVFDADNGLEDAVVFMIHETSEGVIWVSTLTGRLFYYADGRFVPFRYNDILGRMKEDSELFYLIDIWPEGDAILRINYQGILRVNNQGEVSWLTDSESDNYYIYTTRDPGSRHPRQSRFYFGRLYDRGWSRPGPVLIYGESGWEPYGDGSHQLNDLAAMRSECLRMDDGSLVIPRLDSLYHLFPDGRRYSFPLRTSNSTHVLPAGENQFFLTGIGGYGLRRITLDYDKETLVMEKFLEGRSPSMATYDHQGGLWVTTLDAGLFYCPYPRQKLHVAETEGLPPHPTAVAVIDSTTVAGGLVNGGVVIFNDNGLPQQRVDFPGWNTGNQGDDALFDAATNSLLWLSFIFRLEVGEKVTVKKVENYKRHDAGRSRNAIKEFVRIGDSICWSGFQNFGMLDPVTGINKPTLEVGLKPNKYAHGLESFYIFPDGRKFVGTWYGLKELIDQDTLVDNNLGIPELSSRIERIIGWGDGRVAIGTRGDGLVIWSPEGHRVITREQGMASNNVRNLHVTDDGVLWVATLEGLTKVSPSRNGEPPAVRTFNIGNGLIDNEVHDIDSYRNQIWLASTKGIYRFEEPPFDSVSVAPEIYRLTVNGREVPVTDIINLSSQEDNLSISYGATIFSLGDRLLYRYRIDPDPDAPWQFSRERTANFPSLGPGNYRFEVQAENQDGVWSNGSVVYLNKKKAWIRTWQPWALGFLVLSASLFLYVRSRARERIREERYQRKIQQLEHSALHAQMNPHFVFNSLNSIQNFILHNDTRKAATYLARFARLIRQTLRSSVRGAHSLAAEVEMLDRYLELEKLRFKDVFNYQITIDDGLDREAINVPPLLIQPFAENAILHGFKEVAEGGELNIHIGGTPELLVVTVTDNGVGIDPSRPPGEDSLGMSITRQRLNLVRSRKHPRLSLDIKPLVLPDGTPGGTEVTLRILPVPDPAA